MNARTLTKADFRYSGATAEVGGLTVTVTAEHDECHGAPWEEEDGHGPVTGWKWRDKRPSERVLCTDRSAKRFYDFAEAMTIARRDGWGLSDEHARALAAKLGKVREELTAGEIAGAAVERDFAHLAAWCSDQWEYVVICVKLTDADGRELGCDSLGGVGSCGDYWRECAAEMANALLAAHVRETAERLHWEERDTVTR